MAVVAATTAFAALRAFTSVADQLGPNMYSSGSLDAYVPNARADNAIAWRGSFGGLTLGAHYSFGRDTVNAGPSSGGTNCRGETAGDSRACRGFSALAKFDAAVGGFAVAVDEIRGGAGAFGGLTSGDLADRRISANGYLKWSKTKLSLGLIRRDNDGSAAAPKSDLWYVAASYALTPVVTLDGQAYRLSFGSSPERAVLFAVRAQYAFSRRTTAYVTSGRIDNDGSLALSVSGGAPGGTPAVGGSQLGVTVGLRHAF